MRERDSLILVGEPGSDDSREMSDDENSTIYKNWLGSVRVEHDPLHFEFRTPPGGS